MEQHVPEGRACAEAAEGVQQVRETLEGSGVLHTPFRRLYFVPTDSAD